MAGIKQAYVQEQLYRGNTHVASWPVFELDSEGAEVEINLLERFSDIVISIRKSRDPRSSLALPVKSVDNGGVNVIDTNIITVSWSEEETGDILEGLYWFDVKLVYTSGEVETWISGNFVVTNNVTK